MPPCEHSGSRGTDAPFSAGADIAALAERAGPPDFLRFIEEILAAFRAIEELGIPTIAAPCSDRQLKVGLAIS